MQPYLDLLRRVRAHGVWKDQRATDAAGRPLRALSVFGETARYDLRAGFPLVTTKRVPFRLVWTELLWFLSGSTNNRDLSAMDNHIWDEWADPETGELGPIYGRQWRRWRGPDGREVDQIANLLADVRAVAADPRHPAGRRLLVSAWNPAERPGRAPFACHTLAQWNVTDGRLSCQMYQRSADLFLGVPFNVAGYALLTHLVAHVAGLQVGEFVHALGDAHIYENHIAAVDTQLAREPRPLPTLWLDPAIDTLDGLRQDQARVEGYDPHPTLRGEVAV